MSEWAEFIPFVMAGGVIGGFLIAIVWDWIRRLRDHE